MRRLGYIVNFISILYIVVHIYESSFIMEVKNLRYKILLFPMTPMTPQNITTFNTTHKEASLLEHIWSLLYRDMDALMPEDGHEERSEQMSLMSKYSHQLMTTQTYESAVMSLMEQIDSLDPVLTRRVQLSHKELMIDKSLSTEFIQRRSDAHNTAHKARVQARKDNDFASFAPHLQTNIDLDREYVDLLWPLAKSTVYDTLLDIYEEGITAPEIDQYFWPIKDICQKIITKHQNTHAIELPEPDVSLEMKKKAVDALVDRMWFVRSAGTTGVVTHPFMTTLGVRDIRINTRYTEGTIDAISSMIHELWHGLYEQYCSPDYYHTNLHGGASLGVHESQSRYLENIIGRSKPFVSRLCAYMNEQGVPLWTPDDVYAYLNHVSPSLIRVEADEVSYNLHIIIRHELAQQLVSGTLDVKDLPEAWNALYKAYLWVDVPSDTFGCLQDVHWTSGFWYFPTYTLGNIYGAELREQMMQDHPDLFAQVGRGEFSTYIDRSREHIWQYGKLYTPAELITRVTKKQDITSDAFVRYLSEKYL